MNKSETLTREIHHINLKYLLLLQRVSHQKKDLCLSKLGINETVYNAIKELSLSQMISIAETNQLIIKIRSDALGEMIRKSKSFIHQSISPP